MTQFLLLLISVVFFLSCQKEADDPVETQIYFSGITKRDANGSLLSFDSSDWRADDVWSMKEKDLFTSTHSSTCTPSYDYVIHAYPNPGNGVIALYLDMTFLTRLELRLVDEDFNKLITNDSVTQNNIHLNATTFEIHDTVRLYYKFINNGCEFKGHGDIIIE